MSGLADRARAERLAAAIKEKKLREERRKQSNLGGPGYSGGLMDFVRYFWHVLEPSTPLVEGWVMRAICMHLEAVTRGEIRRLVINVPPGFAKSILVSTFWPAWHWSAAGKPSTRFMAFSYAAHLTERDNQRFLDVIKSPVFQEMWGHVVELTADGKIKPTNTARGWKFASSLRGVGTGERADVVAADDLNNIKEGESEQIRSETSRWVREGMSNRLNDMRTGVIVGIAQRVHEDDASSVMLKYPDCVHLRVPMEYDPAWPCKTSIGWEDPRTEFGELAWPERFPATVVADLKRTLGPYAWAGQYQQNPEPRGGGILKRDWWGAYELPVGAPFRHPFEFIVASLDSAFTAKTENDPSAATFWGVYNDKGRPKIVLLHAWQKWLELHGQTMERLPNEKNSDYVKRTSKDWGLVEWVAHDCKRLRVNVLLVEAKASGHSVAQEIKRLYRDREWGVTLINPGAFDKRARAYAVQHLFADGMIEAPAAPQGDLLVFRDWAEMTIDECAKFRGLPSDSDNLVDSSTMALKYLRDRGFALRDEERQANDRDRMTLKEKRGPLYPV